jgi:hypothetical protein
MKLQTKYVESEDVLEVDGVRYAAQFFRDIANHMPIGSTVEIIKRDGVIDWKFVTMAYAPGYSNGYRYFA